MFLIFDSVATSISMEGMPSSFSKEYDFKLAKEAGLPVDRWPESEEEVKRVEDLLAADLERLSLDEHEKALFDIHGITNVEEESPGMINTRLDELQVELDCIESKGAYNLALDMNPEHVQSRSFRLLFLRGERFDVKAAAKMIVSHFEAKQMYFGSGEILAREVHQSDLSEIDMLILRRGDEQVLPVRDASGRAIIFLHWSVQFPEGTLMNECRVMWYQAMSMLRDEEFQKRGSVFLIMKFSSLEVNLESFLYKLSLSRSLPNKHVAGHFCYNDPDLTPFIRGFPLMVSEHDRYRLRIHFGNRDELDSTLQTYGIPTEAIPLKKDGSLEIEDYHASLDKLRDQEERVVAASATLACSTPSHPSHNSPGEERIDNPGRFDVLFGKSLLAKEHTGTRRALHIVEMRYEEYERARGKFQKTDIAERVISSELEVARLSA